MRYEEELKQLVAQFHRYREQWQTLVLVDEDGDPVGAVEVPVQKRPEIDQVLERYLLTPLTLAPVRVYSPSALEDWLKKLGVPEDDG
jgi:hypothetical protein